MLVHGTGVILDSIPTLLRVACRDTKIAFKWIAGHFYTRAYHQKELSHFIAKDFDDTIHKIQDEAKEYREAANILKVRHQEKWGLSQSIKELE